MKKKQLKKDIVWLEVQLAGAQAANRVLKTQRDEAIDLCKAAEDAFTAQAQLLDFARKELDVVTKERDEALSKSKDDRDEYDKVRQELASIKNERDRYFAALGKAQEKLSANAVQLEDAREKLDKVKDIVHDVSIGSVTRRARIEQIVA
jgi:chromosome segregation ATPase